LNLEENVGTMRARHGLKPFTKNTWKFIMKSNLPLVIPIQEHCFGGKPKEWHENAILTNFIFLRKGPTGDLTPKFVNFIKNAKEKGRKILAIGFSSMPVPRSTILEIVTLLAEKCEGSPAVIALVGNKDFSQDKIPKAVEEKAEELKKEGRILEEKGAPFGKLFPELDCIIIHGGLGTTAEALRVGVPVIVTGVLLMDQRFWGKRVYQLGYGPEPVHISDFPHVCVDLVNKALKPGCEWAEKAKIEAKKIIGESEDGVEENVRAFLELEKVAKFANTGPNLVVVEEKNYIYQ